MSDTKLGPMIAAIEGGHDGPCIIHWTGRKGLSVKALTYCGADLSAADGVLQLPSTSRFHAACKHGVMVAAKLAEDTGG